MPVSTYCTYEGRTISIDQAIELRDQALIKKTKYPIFTCYDCGERVRVHRAGGMQTVHFEHHAANPDCELSY